MSEDDRDPEVCGEPNKTGGACQNPAVNGDGSCWVPGHGPDEDDHDPEKFGRPSKLTHERQERVCNALAEGYSAKVAAVTAGICEGTFHRWRKKGRAAKEAGEHNQYREFHERTERARVEGERKWTEQAYEYAREAESFGAVMEILRKRYPESWGGQAHEDDDGDTALNVYLSDGAERDREYATSPGEAGDTTE